jgi:hypothetical protein
MALVGFDNNVSQCKFVDSYGDRTDGGFRYWSYSTMISRLPCMLVRPMINAPTPADALRYTGFIRLRHKVSRSFVTVGIGVTGQEEKIIWPAPGSAMALDDSEYLSLRFPLPSYASSYWPPKLARESMKPHYDWYVRITETSPNPSTEIMGCVEEIVLYDRLESVITGGHWFNANQDIARGASIIIRAGLCRKPRKHVPPRIRKPRYR